MPSLDRLFAEVPEQEPVIGRYPYTSRSGRHGSLLHLADRNDGDFHVPLACMVSWTWRASPAFAPRAVCYRIDPMKEENARGWAVENAKVIADFLTGVRFFIASLVFICALFAERSLLSLVVCLTLLGWTTDVIDGKMARLDPYGRKTWIGEMDFATDMVMIYCGLLYFITSGFVPFWPFLCYMVFAAATAIFWTKKSVMMAVAAPIAAMPIIFSFLYEKVWGWIFIGWIALALALNWKRFVREIGEFIEDVEKG